MPQDVNPEQAVTEAAKGSLRHVYLVAGEERFLVDRVIAALRDATIKGGISGFNEDKFTAGEATADTIISAARMLPMMAKHRFVLVRGLERWEKRAEDEGGADESGDAISGKKGSRAGPLDDLAEYAKNPSPSTVLVLVATKLNAQRKLVSTAKKGDFLVSCEPLARRALPGWIEKMVREKGHSIPADVADYLAEIAGPELGYVADAIERLSLYVGPGQPITEDAVATLITRVRQNTVWELLDALGQRKLERALAVLADVVDPKDGGLKLLGAVTWSVRQLVKFEAAIGEGASAAEAAQKAGMQSFKANEAAQTVKMIPKGTLSSWLRLLMEADLALKSSRRPAQAVLETMVIAMCR